MIVTGCSAPAKCTAETCQGCCGADGSCGVCEQPALPDVPMSPIAFYDLHTGKICDLALRCQLFATRADCLEDVKTRFDYPRFLSAERGLGTLDRREARRCLQNVDLMTCRTFSFQNCYYPALVLPKSKLGEKCRILEDCSEGVCSGSLCSRTCVVDLPVGSFCQSNFLQCGANSSCIAQKCQRDPGVGMPCPQLSCDSTSRCSAGTCQPYSKPGQTCSSTFECAGGYCANGKCTAWAEDGASCTKSDMCRRF